ncbi:unnamed protein product, partial [Rotaria magnacalcarata]
YVFSRLAFANTFYLLVLPELYGVSFVDKHHFYETPASPLWKIIYSHDFDLQIIIIY